MSSIRDTFKSPVQRRVEEIHIVTAVACTDQQKEKLEAKFLQVHQKENLDFVFVYEVDPNIFSGVILKTKNNSVDTSLKNKLTILKEEVLEQIELDQKSEVEAYE